MVETLEKEYLDIVNNELLGGLADDPSLQLDYDWSPRDDVQNRSIGYNFIADARNPYLKSQNALIKLMLDHPKLRGRYHFRQDDKIVFKAGACNSVLRSGDRARLILSSMIILTSGNPGRAEELAPYGLRNTALGSTRNVVIQYGIPVLCGGYHKGSNHVSLFSICSPTVLIPTHRNAVRRWSIGPAPSA